MPTPAVQTHLHEASRVHIWLQTLLVGDATLAALVTGGWWRSVANRAVTRSSQLWGVYQRSGGVDAMGVGSYRMVANDVYTVKIIGAVTSDTVDGNITSAADRLDTLLQAASGTTSDGNILACTREQQVEYDEVIDDVFYRHAGGIYRVLSQPLTGA